MNTSDTPCTGGVGLPAAGATLPTTPLSYTLPLPSTGLPNNMCVLAGFPTLSNKNGTPVNYPFGLWFADANTLYVADEGDGTATYDATTNTYTDAAGQTNAGLEKWVFNATAGQWQLAYTLSNGLEIGTPYAVPGYPTGLNAATGLPWSPTTDGLRNITRPREWRRHRDHLGHHLDDQRRRRHRRRSRQAGGHHGLVEQHLRSGCGA